MCLSIYIYIALDIYIRYKPRPPRSVYLKLAHGSAALCRVPANWTCVGRTKALVCFYISIDSFRHIDINRGHEGGFVSRAGGGDALCRVPSGLTLTRRFKPHNP